MTFDLTCAIVERLARQRTQIIENALIAICPDCVVTIDERVKYLTALEVRIVTDAMENSETLFVGGTPLLTLRLEFVTEDNRLLARYVTRRCA